MRALGSMNFARLKNVQPRKTTAITRVGVRESCVSRHHGGPFKPPCTPQHYGIEGLKGVLNGSPIMPRVAIASHRHRM